MIRQTKLNTPEKRARVGERIKVAATQSGLSLKELAQQSGVSPSAIYQYVRGITAIPMPLLERIAEVTRVHANFFDPEQDARQMLAMTLEPNVSEASPAPASTDTNTRSRIEAEYRQIKLLAESYRRAPQNYAEYLSTLEQMLTLARALESRDREGLLLAELGQARLQHCEYPRACADLQAAREVLVRDNSEAYLNVTMDLGEALLESGSVTAAREYLEEVVAAGVTPGRWRAELLLGRIRFQANDFAGALVHYGEAAEAILAQNSPLMEQTALLPLASATARLAQAAGYMPAALRLWRNAARHSEQLHDPVGYVNSLTALAVCLQTIGDLREAAHVLEIGSMLAEFLPQLENRQSQLRALLAHGQQMLGALEEGRENARIALRIAHRTGSRQDAAFAGIAAGELRLAAGQIEEALDYAREAMEEARGLDDSGELARAHSLRARAFQQQCDSLHGDAAVAGLTRALNEARVGLECAERARMLDLQLEARMVIAGIYQQMEQAGEAERTALAALDLIEAGPLGLKSLLNTGTNNLLSLLSSEVDLPSLFQSSGRLHLPLLEWRLYRLVGSLAESRGDIPGAFVAYRNAAQVLFEVLYPLNPSQARAFQKHDPQTAAMLEGLRRTAHTKDQRRTADMLTERFAMLTEQIESAVVVNAGVGIGAA